MEDSVCKERDQLTVAYLESVAAIQTAAAAAGCASVNTPSWKKATERARAESEKARVALNQHRIEHEC